MRLHHLEIQAFGPFATTSTVDLDALSAAGLFLLSGATGAGKTSVLDAVCFALYGDVPGDRSSAKRLRCDQAAPGLLPRVVLEATLAGRRFRFVRSPAWDRPKKRGTGTTTEQASVVVSEQMFTGRMKGDWVVLSTRLDEAGQLVSQLVGMTLTQFTQVAMLPQGRFQTFLRSRSEDRHHLLQQLFRTGRFHEVERWLRDHRLELRRSAAAAHHDLADVVSRVSETTSTTLPDGWDLGDLSGPLREGVVDAWLAERAEVVAEAVALTVEQVDLAVEHETLARAELTTTRDLLARRLRHGRALADQRDLDGAAARHADDVRRLEQARRAAPVVPVVRAAAAAHRAHEAAAVRATTSRAEADTAVPHLRGTPDDGLEAAARALGDDVARARATLPREADLGRCRAESGRLAAAATAAGVELTELTARGGVLPGLVAAATALVEGAESATRRVVELAPERELLASCLEAVRETVALRPRIDAARVAHVEAREAALECRRTLLDVREARLTSMAAEIAGALVVGACCPVCGSCDHPQVATAAVGAADATAEEQAQRALDDAQLVEHLRDVEHRDLVHRLGVLVERAAEGTADDLVTRLATLDVELDEARVLASALPAHRAEASRLDDERLHLAARTAEAAAALGTATARRDAARAGVEALQDELAALLEPTGHPQVSDLVAHLERQERAVTAAARHGAEARRCAAAAGEAAADLDRDLGAAGFASADEVAALAVAGADLQSLADRVSEHDRRRAACAAMLVEFADDPDPADTPPLPDVDVLVGAHDVAVTALGAARGRCARAEAACDRLAHLTTSYAGAVAAWLPVADDLELATRLAAFAEGRSADNRLQMRLSAYVVAHRLSQVVAAANERLAAMSDQRYSLEHTATRGVGETRGGLSLLVRDDWSGESRDPATLSGGETFVVSLALALGLADVITQEAGGADLDTLFVDEGFGSLDADTLDDVMDTLDTLRDGGRVVGVVSHVAEMRDRIPTRLLVAKSRTGSTLTQVP